MDQILNKLILPDNVSISEGTDELQEAFKSPEAIPGLCSVIVSSPNPQIRQLAAVILRKKLAKHRYWSKLPLETKAFVKQGLLKTLVNEPEKSVKKSIGQVIGVLLRHEIPENSWPEAMEFIQQTTTSQNISDKELGFFTLQILTEISGDQFLPHAHSFATLFSNTLNSIENPASKVAYFTVQCMINMVSAIENDQFMVNSYHGMIPQVMAIVKCLSKKRSDEAIETLSLIDELADFAMSVIVPHLKMIVETCLELAIDPTCDSDLRIKALHTVGMLVQSKKKQIVKLNLVEPIVHVLFCLMSVTPEDENEEEYFPDMEESSTPSTVANQTLDTLALHLPPEKLLPLLMDKYVVQNMLNSDPHVRKAVLLAMAVVAEGCAEYIRQRLVQSLIPYVMAGLRDPSQPVCNAALFAVGQFSEHLQPNISLYASELVPFLLEHLHNITKKEDAPPVKVDRLFYALESFCENLSDGLLNFLPALMQLLIPLLSPPYAVHIRELAISAVGACGNAAKEGMMPYFQQTMDSLKIYLTEVQSTDTMCLQVQSVDTLGILARTIGSENFMPMAKETVELGIRLISNNDDPDLRKSTYGLFAAVATVLKQDMTPFLPTIMESIISSIKSDSGVVINLKADINPAIGLFENTSDVEDEEDLGNTSDVSSDKDDIDEAGLTVENAYLEEKEEAVIAVRDLAQNCNEAFLPFVETCFQEICKLLNYPHDDIRSAALCTLSQLCVNLHKAQSLLGGSQVLLNSLQVLVPKCAEIIRTDCERDVVIAGLDVYTELLRETGAAALAGDGHADAIINCVKDVLNCRTECQDQGEEEGEEAEGDEMLIESAGEIIPLLGKAMEPQQFAQHYTQFLPMFYNLTKKQSSDAQRSFGVGMIAECMGVAGPCLQVYAAQLMSFLEALCKDQSDEVRNNAIFALGELVYHGRESIYPYYPQILQVLSSAVVVEKNSGALDNICGALARLIIVNSSLIPLDQVIPVFVCYLPLREDFAENKWVYQSLTHLYQIGCEFLVQNLNQVIKASAVALHENQIEPENKEIILNLLKKCHSDFPSECAKAAAELQEPIATTLKQACVS